MLIFLDCETTGLEVKDRICSIGFIAQEDDVISAHDALIKSSRKIRPEASALHHITNEMLKDQADFAAVSITKQLETLNTSENTLISHNADFDLQMLQKEGFVWQGEVIDTLKCTRHLISECEQYGLQYLRYELKLYQDETALSDALHVTLNAHNALSDALHVKLLYEYLLDMAPHEKLLELSFSHVLLSKFTFGKYKGRYIEEIAMMDRGYLEWMLNNLFDMDEDLRYSIEHYL